MTPEAEALITYMTEIPDFIIIILLLAGGIAGFLFSTITAAIEEISFFIRERRIKRRLKNAPFELVQAVEEVINRYDG